MNGPRQARITRSWKLYRPPKCSTVRALRWLSSSCSFHAVVAFFSYVESLPLCLALSTDTPLQPSEVSNKHVKLSVRVHRCRCVSSSHLLRSKNCSLLLGDSVRLFLELPLWWKSSIIHQIKCILIRSLAKEKMRHWSRTVLISGQGRIADPWSIGEYLHLYYALSRSWPDTFCPIVVTMPWALTRKDFSQTWVHLIHKQPFKDLELHFLTSRVVVPIQIPLHKIRFTGSTLFHENGTAWIPAVVENASWPENETYFGSPSQRIDQVWWDLVMPFEVSISEDEAKAAWGEKYMEYRDEGLGGYTAGFVLWRSGANGWD